MSTWWHELRLLRRDRSAWVILLLWCAALLYALGTGWQVQSHTRAEVQAFEVAGLKRIDDLRATFEAAERVGSSVGIAGRADVATPIPSDIAFRLRAPAVLAPTPLAFLSVGESDLRPTTATVSLFTAERSFIKGHELQSPVTLAVGRFDLTFAVVLLLPLVLLALSYTQLAEDRERHRLPLLASQGSVQAVLWRRLALRGASACVPLVTVTGVAAWVSGGGAALGGWLGWLAPVLAWALLWLALCAVVGGRARHSGSAAALLVSCWLVLVLLLPALLNAAMQSMAPGPSALKATMAARSAEVEADRQRERIIGRYVSDHPELNVTTAQDELAWARRYYMQQQFIVQSLSALRAETQQARQQQQAMQQALSWASPAQLLEHALTRTAGTHEARYEAFAEQLRSFKQAWDAPLATPLLKGKGVGGADLANLPRFTFAEPDQSANGLVALWLLTLAALCVGADRMWRTQAPTSRISTTTTKRK